MISDVVAAIIMQQKAVISTLSLIKNWRCVPGHMHFYYQQCNEQVQTELKFLFLDNNAQAVRALNSKQGRFQKK